MFGLKVTLITEMVTKIQFITCLDFEAKYPLYTEKMFGNSVHRGYQDSAQQNFENNF